MEKEPLPTKHSEMSPLGHRILKHWREFRPKTVARLEKQGTLHQTAEQAAIDHAETFSEMRSKGFAVDQATEAAREPWITPEHPSDPTNEEAAT